MQKSFLKFKPVNSFQMTPKKLFCLFIAATLIQIHPGFSQDNLFKDGDKVCYIGSSIAMNGACFHFTNLFYATRYPDRQVKFLNKGISGDVTDQILNRLGDDITADNPTWCVLMIEENDLRPSLYYASRQNELGIKEKQEQFVQHWMKNTDIIVDSLLHKGIKVILQTPTIFDEVIPSMVPNSPGINQNLKRCADHLKAIGRRLSLPVVDCWTALNDINQKIQSADSTKTIISRDRMHVSALGHFVMAVTFLRTQNAAGTVSHIVIDTKEKKVVQNENCKIDNFKSGRTSVSFSSLANALPFPTPDDVTPDSLFNFTDELNADILRVTGLQPGNYVLEIDGEKIHRFSQTDLEKGVNLSHYHNTPQYRQSEAVLAQFRTYWKHERTLRTIRYVEYQHRNDLKGIRNVEQLKTDLPNIMAKYKSSDNYNFFTNMFNAYIMNKPKEKELHQQAEQILAEIARLNKPMVHHYSLSQDEK